VKALFDEMRQVGVRGVPVDCADYQCGLRRGIIETHPNFVGALYPAVVRRDNQDGSELSRYTVGAMKPKPARLDIIGIAS
jgi:hypothetical protein